jgi:EmrB/QacA subfamily drug resistance transporter
MASIAFLDFTIVYTSLPAMQVALNVPVIKLQLVMSVFALALATSMIFVGKLADKMGKRKLFFFGTFVFIIAAFGTGFSSNFEMLVFYRLIQGLAAAIIFTASCVLAPLNFEPEKQAVAISAYNGITGLGLALGPFLGGVIVAHWGWRWIFFINIPIALIGFLLCLGNVQETKKQEHVQCDFLGFSFFSIGLGLIIFLLSYGNVLGWSSMYFIGGMILGVAFLVCLVFVEKKQPFPLLDIEDLTNPKVMLAILSCLAASVMTGILMLFVPLYLSGMLAYSATMIGYFMLATPIMQVVVSLVWPKSVKRFGVGKLLIAGITTCLLATFMMIFFNSATPPWFIISALLLMGIIWGITNAVGVTLATTSVPAEKSSGVIGMIYTSWNVAGCILIALSSVIFSQVELATAQKEIQQYHLQLTEEQHHSIAAILADPEKAQALLKQMSPQFAQEVFTLFKNSFLNGFHVVMMCSCFLLFLALIACCYLIKRYKIE